MLMRALSIGVMAVAVAASAAVAAGLTDRLQAERMTVVKVDQAAGRFYCAEHRRWTRAAKADLAAVQPGDVVRVEHATGGPAHLAVVRTAPEEITSPEM